MTFTITYLFKVLIEDFFRHLTTTNNLFLSYYYHIIGCGITMRKNWYVRPKTKIVDESTELFRLFLEDRLDELFSELLLNDELNSVLSQNMLSMSIDHVIADAILESNCRPVYLRLIIQAIQNVLTWVTYRSLGSQDPDPQWKTQQDILIKDSSFGFVRNVFEKLFLSSLTIPPDVERRLRQKAIDAFLRESNASN